MTTLAERQSRRQAWKKAYPTTRATTPDPVIIDMPESRYAARVSWPEAVLGLFLAVIFLPVTLALLIWGWWDDRRSLATMRRGPTCLNAQRGGPCLTYGLTPKELDTSRPSLAGKGEKADRKPDEKAAPLTGHQQICCFDYAGLYYGFVKWGGALTVEMISFRLSEPIPLG